MSETSERGVDTVMDDKLFVARAEALAMSTWSAAERLDRAQADATIRASVLAHGGVRGCAAALAQEFGDHPEIIAARMSRARLAVTVIYDHVRSRTLTCAMTPTAAMIDRGSLTLTP
jgi:hypothetical protein